MKKLKLTKVIASSLIAASVLALNPIGVSAEWKLTSNGWQNTDFYSKPTGWINSGGGWYYKKSDGSMATAWNKINDKWYYFSSDGLMASSKFVEGGYGFNSTSIWLDGTPIGTYYYVDSSGARIDVTTSGNFKLNKSIGEIVGYSGTDTTVTIPSSIDGVQVRSIGQFAFGKVASKNCSSLTSITIPKGVTSIGNYAFDGCSSLTSITIPEGVTSIGDTAFGHCNSLISITIPNSVTSIGKNLCPIDKSTGVVSNVGVTSFTSDKEYNSREKAVFYVASEKIKKLLINSGIHENKIILNGKS